jgi:hypothetical protein
MLSIFGDLSAIRTSSAESEPPSRSSRRFSTIDPFVSVQLRVTFSTGVRARRNIDRYFGDLDRDHRPPFVRAVSDLATRVFYRACSTGFSFLLLLLDAND